MKVLPQGEDMTAPTYPIECPKCQAESDRPCRSLITGRMTDIHADRVMALIVRAARPVKRNHS